MQIGHRVVFLGNTISSHSAVFHPGIQMGPVDCLGSLRESWGVTLRWPGHGIPDCVRHGLGRLLDF